MINPQEVKEAVKHLKFRLDFKNLSESPLQKQNDSADETLLFLAEAYLSASGKIPEKLEQDETDYNYAFAYNKAIDLCTLAVMKGWVKKAELPDKAELFEIILDVSIGKICLSDVKVAEAIAKRLGEVEKS